MNIIIPIGDLGQEFHNHGYLNPKPLVKFLGRPMIFWVLDQFKQLEEDDTIYIIYHHELKKYNFREMIKDNYKNLNLKFIEIFYQTQGVIETLLMALKNVEQLDRKLISFDCDTFYRRDLVDLYRMVEDDCNYVFYFEDHQDQPFYSYIKMDPENGKQITQIAEKERISNFANSGCYCFSSGEIFVEHCQELLDVKYYVSSVIDLMIQNGERFEGVLLAQDDFVCLGNPHLLQINSQRELLRTPRRFCFDLDYTLVKMVTQTTDYTQVVPIWRNINLLNFLKEQGHTIIIQTARRMRTHRGNTGKILKDIGKITFETLEKFGIQYDEIYFGKPWADYYIDDLAINSYYNLEQELGYYSLFIPERTHNNLSINEKTVTKRSQVLEGEIHWYQNIPSSVSDLFPKLIQVNSEKTCYEIEKIDGITLSHFYLNENLSTNLFYQFIQQIERVHASQKPDEGLMIDLYANYLPAVPTTIQNYDYSRFPRSSEVYERLCEYFKDYLRGELTVIHGDPVFTNVLLTKFMNFKLIDMRGKQVDGTLTIFGDCWYDYAKIYQSLVGYDQILLQKKVNRAYQKHLLEYYEEYLQNKYGKQTLEDIKWIAASLLFTLIPLHDNEKCLEYYNLINEIVDV